jgi:hypothetical protein
MLVLQAEETIMDKIAQRIQKILDKANSTDSDAEAAMLMQKVHNMLDKHGMDLLELGKLDEDPLGVQKGAVECAPSEKWQVRLIQQVARYYGCQTVYKPGYINRLNGFRCPTTISLAGRESARMTVKAMWPFIRQQVRALGRQLAKETGRGPSSEVNAVANALTLRIHRLVEQQESVVPQKTRNALVPVDEIEAVLAEAFPDLVGGKKVRISSNSKARDAASKVSLYRQTGSSRGQKRLT